jgi:polyhydroxyalkanoate synthesis regulator phasin
MSDKARSDPVARLRLVDSLLTAVEDNLSSFQRLLSEVHTEVALLRQEEEEQSRDEEIQALRREVAQLREGLTSRAVIERAKGILMQRGDLTEAEAFELLNEMSQRRHRKLREVAAEVATGAPAAHLVAAGSGGRASPGEAVEGTRRLVADGTSGWAGRGGAKP